MESYDVVWIGSGQATGTVVPRLAKAGKKVAIVEGGPFGGTCVNNGCTPTKTIIASARAAHIARRGADFGVMTGEIKIDFARVMERQNRIRKDFSEGLESWLRGLDNVTIYDGFGVFEDDHTVRVGEQLFQGETIVINAGGRARIVPINGLDEVDWLDNVRLLDLKTLPSHLIIAGGSYIGLEFAQAFRRLGSEVTVIELAPRIMINEDEDISKAAQEILEKEGITFHLNAQIQRVAQPGPEQIDVSFKQDEYERQVTGSHLLVAIGRIPNSDRLNLQAAGVETDSRGYIPVNDKMQTNVPHIFALGDINGRGAFTHTSVNDGEIFWDQLTGEGPRTLSRRISIYVAYIDPPLARVGMSETEARKDGRRVLMATRPMRNISRAIEKDETDGLVKIIVDAHSEEILGATILGVGSDEVISMFAPFMMAGQSYRLFRQTVLPHPTVSELMPWILDDLQPLQ